VFRSWVGRSASCFVLGSLLTVGVGSASAFPLLGPFPADLKIGQYKAKHTSVYKAWYRVQFLLGQSKYDESYTKAVGTKFQSEGSAMGFTNGVIVRISSPPRAGKITVVSGEIFKVYDRLAGTHSRLGFPLSGVYVYNDATGAKAQNFEGGMIYWSTSRQQYEVKYWEGF
jgi:hypothetical protein